ncbi:MAG TPA: hypothetical protein VF363_05550 [Candidatus Eisenbacteria bacterium]
MKLPIRLTILFVILFAAVTLILGGVAPIRSGSHGNSPYLSSLSDAAVPSAEAIPCNLKYCSNPGQHNGKCYPTEEYTACGPDYNTGVGCITVPCFP